MKITGSLRVSGPEATFLVDAKEEAIVVEPVRFRGGFAISRLFDFRKLSRRAAQLAELADARVVLRLNRGLPDLVVDPKGHGSLWNRLAGVRQGGISWRPRTPAGPRDTEGGS